MAAIASSTTNSTIVLTSAVTSGGQAVSPAMLSYAWTITQGDTSQTFTTPTVTFPLVNGVYQVTLVVTEHDPDADLAGPAVSQTFTIVRAV